MITCDGKVYPWLYESYDALADTLVGIVEMEGGCIDDTIQVQYFNYRGEPGSKDLLIFNDRGLMTHAEQFGKDSVPGISYSFVYNAEGFQAEATFLDKDKKVKAKTTSGYEYDEKGNWFRATFRNDKGFAIICERVYTYFE